MKVSTRGINDETLAYITFKAICTARRLTQEEVARRAGLDPAAFSRIVSGVHLPNVRLALKIAKVLNCKVEDLWPDAAGVLYPAGRGQTGRPRKPVPTPP